MALLEVQALYNFLPDRGLGCHLFGTIKQCSNDILVLYLGTFSQKLRIKYLVGLLG